MSPRERIPAPRTFFHAVPGTGVPRGGNIQIDAPASDDEIVMAILQHPSDGPTAQQVRDWIVSRPDHEQFAHHRLGIRVSWVGGEIDRASYIQLLEPLAPPVAPAPPLTPVPSGSKLVSVSQYLGYAARPPHDDDAEKTA